MQTSGYRQHIVKTGLTGFLSRSGAVHRVEVDAAADTMFYPNAFEDDGTTPRPSDGIPIKAGVTRVIPMQIYNYKADASVTVVAYRS